MERRKQEETEISTSHQLTGTLALKHFTIPRKKRTSGEVVLEWCPEESRDYTLIQSKLRDSRLDTRQDQSNTWLWKDVRLVHNDTLLRRFSEKRAEMRAKGRHGREMEERFCFLVASDQDTTQIYQDGLKVGSSVQHALGKPSHGVYLFRYVDVALKSTVSVIGATNLLIFKVLYGKVKKMSPSLTWKKSQDPTIGFDCHMSKDAVSPRDTPNQQVLGSSVFLFDFNENQELNERPRQCLPYAVVSFVPTNSVILTTPPNLALSPTSHDGADRFRVCTVAQRRGKGDNATITFKHFGTTQNPKAVYPFQKAQNMQAPAPRYHQLPINQINYTTVSQNVQREEANQEQNTADTQETLVKCDTNVTLSPLDNVSTIVYSSHLVKDPRLSKRETNQQNNCLEAETVYTASRRDDRICQPAPQNKEEYHGFESGPKEPLMTDTQKNKDCSQQHSQMYKSTLPSMKLFKMKFQKYAEYFNLNEEERHKKIWSLENMSPEQKQALLDCIHFYEVYYQKYKRGLLSQRVSEKEKISSLSLKEPKGSHNTCKHSQSDVNQRLNNDAANINKVKYQHNLEHCAAMLSENQHNLLPETCLEFVEHYNDCLVPSPEIPSRQSPELGSVDFNLIDERVDSQIVQLKQPVPSGCPSSEGKSNCNIEWHTEPSRVTGEEFDNKFDPGVNLVERPSHDSAIMFASNITAMDIASFVEVSSGEMSDDCHSNSAKTERKNMQNRNKNDRNSSVQTGNSEKLKQMSEPYMRALQENSCTHIELHKRLQLDALLPSKNGEQILSPRAYLTSRVMGGQQKNESETEPQILSCWNNLHLIVHLKEITTPSQTVETLSLSERFSKLKSCQKRATAFANGHKKTGTHNVELIQLLAKRYNMSKLHAKCRSLSRPGKTSCFLKQTSALAFSHSLKTKNVKKKHFWKENKNVCTNIVSTESSKEAVHSTVTLENLSHTLKTVFPQSNSQEPNTNLRETSHTSDAVSDRQQLHAQHSQEANASINQLQDHCRPSNELTLSLDLKSKEEDTNPTEPLTPDSLLTTMKKPTEDVVLEQVVTTTSNTSENKTSLITCDSIKDSSNDYGSTITDEGRVLQQVTSHTELDPVCRFELKTVKLSEDDNVDTSESFTIFRHPTKVLNPEPKVMSSEKIETESKIGILCDSAGDDTKTSETNANMKCTLNSPDIRMGKIIAKVFSQNKNQSCLTTSTSISTNHSTCAINTGITRTNSQVDVLSDERTSNLQHCGQRAWKCASNNVVDLTDENASSDDMDSEHTKSNNTNWLGNTASNTKHASAASVNENRHLSRPEQKLHYDVCYPETQLISKLRDYLTKFESTVKKQEAVNEGLQDKSVVWISLDSTSHKQQLVDKGQCRTRKVPENHVQTGPDVYLLVPAESKRSRRSSQTKKNSRYKSKRARWSLCPSVSPDSTSALDIVKDTSLQPMASVNKRTADPTESKESTRQRSSIICSQDSVDAKCKCKRQANPSVDTTEMTDDGNMSSSFANSDLSASEISNTLKIADQTSSLAELGYLQSKCKNMLQEFILRFERDQKVPFRQSFVSRNLIVEQYLDHPPSCVDLKYEAVNSYLELQMMMEAWQFVENKMNFLRGQPTFRSLLWYDPSLYGELYKGEVGFQQQSSLFTSFQKILAQEGYGKLQEYYVTVSSLHQQLLMDPDASYYMYLKSKREVFEAEAALRNQRNIKSFFLSLPMTAMINFGDSLESLENVHKVIMAFVETPSDQLPGTFDVGKAEHLSITCRYLQEKAFFLRSCKETLTKVSWFGIEHLLYDASKILIWQDMDLGVSNEFLRIYKSSNRQVVFGVTESGVTLVNKVDTPHLSLDGAETTTEKQHKPSQPNDVQSISSGKEVAYSVAKRRQSHPAITTFNSNDNRMSANPLIQPTPTAHAGNSKPYHTPPQKSNSVPWGMMGRAVFDWNTPSTSTVHSEIKSLILSKRRVTSSNSDRRTSLADAQTAQAVGELKWPSVLSHQTPLQGDSCGTRLRFKSGKQQQSSTPLHCPVSSNEQLNQLSLAMAQPFSLPNVPLNANFVAPASLSCQTLSKSLTRVPVPSMLPAINYPYFLLNGQTYTTDSTSASYPYTQYYPNTI